MMHGKDIVCIASSDYDTPGWLNVQNLMSRLAQAGNRVLYVESLGMRTPHWGHASDLHKMARRLRGLFSGMRCPLPGLYVIAPHALPAGSGGWLASLNQWLVTRQIRASTRKLCMQTPILWIFLPTGGFLVGRLGESQVLYHCVDDYLANPGVDQKTLRTMEDHLMDSADAVIVTAPKLLEKFKHRARRIAHIPAGVDLGPYKRARQAVEPADLKSVPHPRIGFVGNLTEYKVDFTLLDHLIRSHPQWHFVLIGGLGGGDPSSKRPAFLTYSNVFWLGEKSHADIPEYLRAWDAGLIPYRRSQATDSVFPIKFFEYLAAGLPVVATSLPSLEPYRAQCRLVSDEPSFVQALEEVLKDPRSGAQERMDLAAQNSWDVRVEQLSQFLSGL